MIPQVTVIVPTFKHAQYLPALLHSLKGQTHPKTQLIIVSVEGDKATTEVLRKQKGIRWIISDKAHHIHQINLGLKKATGKYIMVCGSDDYVLPGKIQSEVAMAEARGSVIVYSPFFYGNALLAVTGQVILPPFSYMGLVNRCFIPDIALVNHQLYEEFGLLDESLGSMAFLDRWLRVGEKHPERIQLQETPNYIYRQHGSQLSDKMGDEERLKIRSRIVEASLDRMEIPHGKVEYTLTAKVGESPVPSGRGSVNKGG